MGNEQKKQSPRKDESQPYSFSDPATKNKIKKHIQDIKDVITEEDIANVKIPGEEDTRRLPEDEGVEMENETRKELPGEGKPITPWDVID
ncbi:MAG: hypothetical protein ACXWWC_10715 [Chitinophagaceae bacterium]